MMKNFKGIEQGPDFGRAQNLLSTPFQFIDIKLDTAGDKVIFEVAGDFLYFDAISTGTVTLELNNQYNDPAAPFQCSAGFGINALFKRLKISWAAQAGKTVRIMYSTGDRIVPTNSTSINGVVTVNQSGYSITSSFSSTVALGANTAEAVFLPAANTNGAVIWEAVSNDVSNVTFQNALVAHTSAPGSISTGKTLTFGKRFFSGASDCNIVELINPVKVPAGFGVYFISNQGLTNGARMCSYTML